MYTEANCSETNWETVDIKYKYLILDPDKMIVKDESLQLVYVKGGSGCSPETFGTLIEVEEVTRNAKTYQLHRYDLPFIGIASFATVAQHKDRYYL